MYYKIKIKILQTGQSHSKILFSNYSVRIIGAQYLIVFIMAYFKKKTKEAIMNFLKINEVAERLKLSRSMIYALMRRGNFARSFKFGKSIRWLDSDVDQWASSQAKEAM